MSLEEVNIILEIQELFSETNTNHFTHENVRFILDNLSKTNSTPLKEKQVVERVQCPNSSPHIQFKVTSRLSNQSQNLDFHKKWFLLLKVD
jgi:hypothetical protein